MANCYADESIEGIKDMVRTTTKGVAANFARAAKAAAAQRPTTEDLNRVTAANKLAELNKAKLDKHGLRIAQGLQRIVDGGTQNGYQTSLDLADRYMATGSAKPGLEGRVVKRANSASRQVQGKEAGPLNPAHGMASKNYAVPLKPGEKPVGHMARGLTSRDAPHSSYALQSNREQATKDKKAAPAAPKPGKTAKVKAKVAAKVTGEDSRKITITDKAFTFGAPGTARRSCWDAMVKAKTVAEYVAAGGKVKYLGRWQSAGAIKLG